MHISQNNSRVTWEITQSLTRGLWEGKSLSAQAILAISSPSISLIAQVVNHNVHANLHCHKFKTRAFPSSQLVQLPACFSLPSLSIIYSVGCLLREAARCSLIPHSGRVCVVARTWNRPVLLCILVYHGGMTLNKLMSPAAGRVSVRVELFHAWVQHLARLCDRL